MKIQAHLSSPRQAPAPRRQGTAVIIVLVLLSIILIYITAAARTLHLLGRDLKRVEQQQIRRVLPARPQTKMPQVTNTVPWTASPPSKNR